MELCYSAPILRPTPFTFPEIISLYGEKPLCFCLDTNVLLDIAIFVKKRDSVSIDKDLLYLKHIPQMRLKQVECAMAIEEASRCKGSSFSSIQELKLWYADIVNYFFYGEIIESQKPWVEPDEYPRMFYTFLEEESPFRSHLIPAYIASLKIVLLFTQIKLKKITPIKAFMDFTDFMQDKIGFSLGPSILLAIKVFWGDNKLQSMIYPNKAKKLQRTFAGSIDLILPILYQLFIRQQEISHDYIPVFVTRDKSLAKLESLITESYGVYGTKLYTPRVLSFEGIYDNKKIDTKDVEKIKNRLGEINSWVASHVIKEDGNSTTHLLPLVQPLEQQVIEMLEHQA